MMFARPIALMWERGANPSRSPGIFLNPKKEGACPPSKEAAYEPA